jgi:DNA-directed RNA polymerase subunit RPC12/RpoP
MPDGFKPGEKVLTTGIYAASHYQHRLPHEVFAVEGDQFPSCRRCGNRILFKLIQAATHIAEDRDFSKTTRGSKTKKAKAGHRRT